MRTATAALALIAALIVPDAAAQDPLDLGVLKNEEIKVVQGKLYPKEGRSEFGVALGLIPFDPYTTAPKAQLTYGGHFSEGFGWEAQLGAGYGLANATYKELSGEVYGVQPEAYRYLASLTGGIQYSPVYAKMALGGGRVLHHDVYLPAVIGATLEQIVENDLAGEASPFSVAPTLGLGLGARIFLPRGPHLRFELRDDLMAQKRASGSWRFKQNVSFTAGVSWLGGA